MISWNLRIAVMNLVVGMAVVTPGRGSDDQPRGPVNSQGQPEVLDLIIKETPKPDYDSPAPAQVSGRVLLRTVAMSRCRQQMPVPSVVAALCRSAAVALLPATAAPCPW